MSQLTLYSTLGCHLCDDAKSIIWSVLPHFDTTLGEVDIADDDALIEAYGVRIPVVKLNDRDDDLGWPFTAEQLIDYLAN